MSQSNQKWRKWRRWTIWALVLAVISALVITFPSGWGPRLAVAIIRGYLPEGKGHENEIAIERISLHGVKIGRVRLGGLPTAPSFDSAEIRFSPIGLLRKRIDSVRISGFTLAPDYAVPNFKMPTKGSAGEVIVNPDPLQGWTFDIVECDTGVIDFGPLLTAQVHDLFPTSTLRARICLEHGSIGYEGRMDGELLGGALAARLDYIVETHAGSVAATFTPRFAPAKARQPGDVTANLSFEVTSKNGYGVKLKGGLSLSGESVNMDVRGAIAPDGIDLYANVTRREINAKTPIVDTLISLADLQPSITDVAFSADASFNFLFSVTNAIPQWKLEAKLRDGCASLKSGEVPLSINGASAFLMIKGIGPHFDILPMPVAFTNAAIGTIAFDGGRATILADQEKLLISEGSVGFCGGSIRLYALYLNFARLFTGFTVFLDGLEVEKFLTMFPQLAGTSATGRLYGRLPLHVMPDGLGIRLSDSFLYTPPGDEGQIRIDDASRVEEMLTSTGLPSDVAANLGKALHNLDYDVLRFDLRQPRGGGDGKLTIRLRGKARDGKIVTPVDVNISLNGALEKVLNYALKTAKMKGK